MALALILIPLVAAALAALTPSNRLRPLWLPAAALLHLALAIASLMTPGPARDSGAWLALDALGKLVLLTASLLAAAASVSAVDYLRHLTVRSNRLFCVSFLAFLGLMSLVAAARHLGLVWVAIEGTTLATAPLIYFDRTPRSLEATWKYLIVCSVGIALGLLGTFFLAYSALHGGQEPTLALDGLIRQAPLLSKPWFRASFLLLLVGYGTKMGLAPMHTWLPEAHSEAPSPVSALLSGALLPCAFLAILRVTQVGAAAGDMPFLSRPLVGMGLFSMLVAAIFLVRQADFKRMLAYSSVEHMGILALALGLGSAARFGLLLHVWVHGLTKAALFLAAGNLAHAYGSKNANQVRGAWRRLPVSGPLFLIGIFAISGSPPFGPFVSEWAILAGACDAGRYGVAALMLLLLLGVFLGMGATALKVVQGRPSWEARQSAHRDTWMNASPIVVLLLLALGAGIALPPPATALLHEAARLLEGVP